MPPEGEARHDHWIMAELFARVKDLYRQQGGVYPDAINAVTLDYQDPRKPTLDEIAKEINGKDLTTGKRLGTFAGLKDDGTTTAGDWIYTGSYPDESAPAAQGRSSANLSKRREGIRDPLKNDPTGMGFYPNWAWSWPLNRRVLYNRASADPTGQPWDPKRPGIRWNGTTWVGDVPDYPPTMNPADPNAYLPFIMNGEGTGRLFSASMADGPFAEHYEPIESPIENPLHPTTSASPVAFLYDQAAGRPNRFGKVEDFPYVATSYRLTEHEHYVTQWVPLLVGLQPQAFVEIPDELGQKLDIKSGDRVRVRSQRGKLEVLALVTKRLGPLTVGGKRIYQVGIPIHWGFVGINRGDHWLANALTPFVGDANARTPEYKAFLVDVEKM
jgi:formate dehydrogenase major subunit